MSSKSGKRKSRKGKNPVPRKVTTRQEYESQITALNGRLAALRTAADKVGCVNDKLRRRMETTQGDHKDVCNHLSRVIEQRDEQLADMEAAVAKSERLLNDVAEEDAERVKELEVRYLHTMNELGKEVELKTALRNSMNEYRREQQAELVDYEWLRQESEQRQGHYKEFLLDVDQKRNVDVSRLRREITANLRQVSNEFLMSTDIREAAYKRNLIRRNTELHTMMEKKLRTVILLHLRLEKAEEKTRLQDEEFGDLKRLIKHLKGVNEKRHAIMVNLRKAHAELEAPYVQLCRNKIVERATFKKVYKRFSKSECLAKIERLTASAERLDKELLAMRTAHSETDSELGILLRILDRLEIALQLAVDTYLPDSWYTVEETPSCDMLGVTEAKRGVLLDELVDVLAGFTDDVMQSATAEDSLDLYTPGDVGFVTKVPQRSNGKGPKSSQFEVSRNGSANGVFSEFKGVSGKVTSLRCLYRVSKDFSDPSSSPNFGDEGLQVFSSDIT